MNNTIDIEIIAEDIEQNEPVSSDHYGHFVHHKHILKVQGLTKDYGNGKGAFDVSFEVRPGEIVGFIGPNGAGKTTTLSMICGFLWPNSGTVEILGEEITPLTIQKVMPDMGIMISENCFEGQLTVGEILNRNRVLQGISSSSREIDELAAYFDLDLKKTYKSLSFGNRKKVALVNSLIGSTKFLVLDEPTAGLDPVIQYKFLAKIRELKEKGAAIILSSHILSEIQSVADRILMIKGGKIILEENTKTVIQKAQKVFRIANCSDQIKEHILTQKLASRILETGEETLFYTTNVLPLVSFLVNYNVQDFYIEKPSLEEMFLELFE